MCEKCASAAQVSFVPQLRSRTGVACAGVAAAAVHAPSPPSFSLLPSLCSVSVSCAGVLHEFRLE